MSAVMLKLRIWVHAETALLKINARRTGQRFTALAIALGLAVLAVGMINIGIFELLAESYGRIKGAFYLAGGNGLLAAIVVVVAQRSKPGLEEEMVAEVREMALTELQADADEIKAEYERIADRVRKIESSVSALTGSGSSLSKLSSLGPVVELATHALKHRHESK
ncbi:MAG: hypothetical protein OES69_12625 [Myxococcales bacterium]|nr:hypothetical protein [Myxococcales bacterium]MDH3844779.1 hypothetical protein [Myxococcales bacterium]